MIAGIPTSGDIALWPWGLFWAGVGAVAVCLLAWLLVFLTDRMP